MFRILAKTPKIPLNYGFLANQGFGSGFIQVSGSGSVFGIRIQEGENDPQK